jgi:tripartite-type tricarboxylate transporter receptor subunit TctC
VKELSAIDLEADAWVGLIAPARTQDAILAKLHDEVVDVLSAPDVKGRLNAQFMTPYPTASSEFASFLRAYLARWEPVIRENKIKLD